MYITHTNRIPEITRQQNVFVFVSLEPQGDKINEWLGAQTQLNPQGENLYKYPTYTEIDINNGNVEVKKLNKTK